MFSCIVCPVVYKLHSASVACTTDRRDTECAVVSWCGSESGVWAPVFWVTVAVSACYIVPRYIDSWCRCCGASPAMSLQQYWLWATCSHSVWHRLSGWQAALCCQSSASGRHALMRGLLGGFDHHSITGERCKDLAKFFILVPCRVLCVSGTIVSLQSFECTVAVLDKFMLASHGLFAAAVSGLMCEGITRVTTSNCAGCTVCHSAERNKDPV